MCHERAKDEMLKRRRTARQRSIRIYLSSLVRKAVLRKTQLPEAQLRRAKSRRARSVKHNFVEQNLAKHNFVDRIRKGTALAVPLRLPPNWALAPEGHKLKLHLRHFPVLRRRKLKELF